jgi:hypothetical protein
MPASARHCLAATARRGTLNMRRRRARLRRKTKTPLLDDNFE